MTRTLHPSEHAVQASVIQWWDIACKGYKLPPYALMAIPNAGKRSYAAANWMRAEGLRKGVPDLFLAVPSMGESACGLWIELKVGRNKPSAEQLALIKFLRVGYRVEVCYSAEEAIHCIKEYLAA